MKENDKNSDFQQSPSHTLPDLLTVTFSAWSTSLGGWRVCFVKTVRQKPQLKLATLIPYSQQFIEILDKNQQEHNILDNTTNQQYLIDIYRTQQYTTQNSKHTFFKHLGWA